MFTQNDVDISNFIQFTKGGIKIASFVEVRESLINKYKEVYGSDIDLSTASADGVFVNNLALIINNILQSFKSLYQNLDVNYASGIYLDTLCSLSNVTRKPASNSTASLNITNQGSARFNQTYVPFVDGNGTEWVYNGNINLGPGESTSIVVKCTEIGPVKAPINFINKTLQLTDLLVEQPKEALVGESRETDANLRARRAQSSGADGTTVLESLAGSLLEISGIRDVKIYNHQSSADNDKSKDNTTLLPHSIYVILRYNENLTINDETIADIIYQKLTPGILTTPCSNTSYNIAYDYHPSTLSSVVTLYDSIVNWKKAPSVHPTITISLTKQSSYDVSEEDIIKENLIEYLNNLPLSTDLTNNMLISEVSSYDPLFLSQSTYIINSISITGSSNNVYTNPDAYYKYSDADIVITYTN